MECEYSKYGCTHKLANSEHLQLHIVHHASSHLQLVVDVLQKEVEKNKALAERVKVVDALQSKVDQLEKRISEHTGATEAVKDLDARFAALRAFMEARLSEGTEVSTPRRLESVETPRKSGDSTGGEVSSKGQESPGHAHRENGSAVHAEVRKDDKEKEEEKKVEAKVRQNILSPPLVVASGGGAAKDRPFIVKSSFLDTEASVRAHTPMSLREGTASPEPVKTAPIKGKTWSNAARDKEVKPPQIAVAQDSPEVDEEYERGIIWEYDPTVDKWCRGQINFKLEKKAFSEGSLRAAHIVQILNEVEPVESPPEAALTAGKEFKDSLPEGLSKLGNRFVAKISKTRVPIERYFEDVRMQMLCAELGKKFNMFNVPKRVEFLHAWVLEIPRTPVTWCGLEAYIAGEFKKHNSNSGPVLTVRNTPQAFSHFSWEYTKHVKLVVDMQGVNDFYTDPQIHTTDGKGFGLGNLGRNGIDRFLKTHQCNAICSLLTLPRINAMDTKEAKQKLIKGTQQVPYIEDQLQSIQAPRLDVPDDVSSGGEFQLTHTLTGHSDRVVSLCTTSKYLFSGSGDGSVRVWSLPSMTMEKELNVHRKSVEAICANDKYLFTASADHSVKVWEISTNFNLVIALRDHTGEVNAMCLTDRSMNYLISASFDKNIKVWSLRTFKCMQTLTGHSKSVKSLAVSGSILFSGSNDGSIYVWNLKFMSCLFAIDAHEGWVKSLSIRDNVLYSGSYDYQIKKWDLANFNCLSTISVHNDNVNTVCATDKYLLSASDDKVVNIIDLETEKVVGTLKGHRSGVQDVVTDGKFIFTGGDDYQIKVWKWCTA